MWAPTTVTRGESFLWWAASPRLQLGLAYLWRQSSVRYLASFRLLDQTERAPSVSVSIGVQGIGTGNPGYSATSEWTQPGYTLYVGIGLRSNEAHGHPLAGAKWSFSPRWTLGLQLDGHEEHPFLTYDGGAWMTGLYLIDTRRPALMFGVRF